MSQLQKTPPTTKKKQQSITKWFIGVSPKKDEPNERVEFIGTYKGKSPTT